MRKVGVIDYGSGNIFSLAKAVEKVGCDVLLISSPKQMSEVDRYLLPGVGAFGSVMQKLEYTGFNDALISVAQEGKPLLGICVGMQVLFDVSHEFGEQDGLGVLGGKVEKIPRLDTNGNQNRIPHIGWAGLIYEHGDGNGQLVGELFKSINDGASFYFVHSFAALPADEDISVAHTIYGGHPITGAVRKGMVFGTQFHPEKSGIAGLRLLDNFVRL